MASAKLETAADRYRRIRDEKAKAETLHDVECECEMVWKARRVGIDFWAASGILPLHLAEVFIKASEKGGQDIVQSMASHELAQSIEFTNKVVKHTAVDPKIVERATEPNEVSQDELLMCCYNRLRDWQMSGGDEAARLGNFPQE